MTKRAHKLDYAAPPTDPLEKAVLRVKRERERERHGTIALLIFLLVLLSGLLFLAILWAILYWYMHQPHIIG